jgi:deoxyribose-phosphate aldolase
MEKYHYANRIISRIYNSDVLKSSITNICYEAMFHGFLGVEVFPNMVELCGNIINEEKTKIFAVIAYPHGTFLPEQKAIEIKDTLTLGADGFEVCINCLNVRSGDWGAVREEMNQARKAAGKNILNFIFEVEYLTDEQIKKCCEIAVDEKIDGIITSTGLYNTVDEKKNDVPFKATEKDIILIKSIVDDNVKITAQGYIDSREAADRLLKAGADFFGIENAMPFILN